MFKHLCPKCGKHSYSADEEYFSPCAHCGHRFSAKNGSDRRCEERFKKEIDIILVCNGEHHKARSIDMSESGLGVQMSGEAPVRAGDMVGVFVDDLQIEAKVVWVQRVPDKSMFGLQRSN